MYAELSEYGRFDFLGIAYFKAVFACEDIADVAALRETVTDLTGKSDNAVILLAAVNEGKVSLCAGVSKALTGK
ncbi:hypothetical protein, partial [Neisseria gonorrhoeae]|uniref:hypothetical protein n=1 Tax=Neisseria gonorrhoeae TaxID=485 RepID=UPI0038511089